MSNTVVSTLIHPNPPITHPSIPFRLIKSVNETMPPPSFLPRKRKLAPAQSSPSISSSSTPDRDEEDEYEPVSTNKRGSRKPNPTKGMSREQLRKANHSLIERRRREKINSALGELRDMVPDLGGEAKGGEFKLEVLERTVAYMKELRLRITELEEELKHSSPSNQGRADRIHPHLPTVNEKPRNAETTMRKPAMASQKPTQLSTTPPSPCSSPDPNETEPETNLPPAYTLSTRTHTPTIASLLQSANDTTLTRPIPSSQAPNPTLYLPFPTPSPTSPFLTYQNGGTSSSSASSGPPEPSPFLAPLQGMTLFGGALNLDHKDKDLKAEEAANVLLAFSSPDTLKPMTGLNLTPKMIPSGGSRERRLTLESEDFVLDGGLRQAGRVGARSGVTGKTARDILRM